MQSLKTYFSNRSTLYNLAMSLFIFYGVAFLNWNPARIVAFFWVEACVFLFFLLLYMKLLGRLEYYLEILMGLIVILPIMFVFLLFVIGLADSLGFNLMLNPSNCADCDEISEKIYGLFYPYFDFSFFITLAVLANAYQLKKLRREGTLDQAFSYYLHMAYAFIMSIPLFIALSSIFSVFTGFPLRLSSVLACLGFRFLMDAWQQSQFRKIKPAEAILPD